MSKGLDKPLCPKHKTEMELDIINETDPDLEATVYMCRKCFDERNKDGNGKYLYFDFYGEDGLK